MFLVAPDDDDDEEGRLRDLIRLSFLLFFLSSRSFASLGFFSLASFFFTCNV
jgi:hypothetical protein